MSGFLLQIDEWKPEVIIMFQSHVLNFLIEELY